jgi:hypothetical protein
MVGSCASEYPPLEIITSPSAFRYGDGVIALREPGRHKQITKLIVVHTAKEHEQRNGEPVRKILRGIERGLYHLSQKAS